MIGHQWWRTSNELKIDGFEKTKNLRGHQYYLIIWYNKIVTPVKTHLSQATHFIWEISETILNH